MIKRVFALMVVMLMLGACASQATDIESTQTSRETAPRPSGSIRVISNGEEHEPCVHFLHGMRYDERHGLLAESGLEPWYAFDHVVEHVMSMDEIQHADDFQVVIGGKYATDEASVRYALYTEDLEPVFPDERVGERDFFIPDETGLYILSVETNWLRGDEYSRLAHIFKIRK